MLSRTKSQLRKEYTFIRESMGKTEVEALSEKIISTVVKLPAYKKADTVMMYLNFKNEVDSVKMIEECFRQGKRVVLPYCIKEDTRIVPTELKDIEKDIEELNMGYLQPKKECIRPISIDDIDLIIVPGIAFDKRCYRLGFGAGYYDRFLNNLHFSIPTIGVCYDYQIIHSIPNEQHDVPLDFIITEKRIIVRP